VHGEIVSDLAGSCSFGDLDGEEVGRVVNGFRIFLTGGAGVLSRDSNVIK